MVVFVLGILSWLQVIKYYEKINYNSLVNPIFIFTPCYLILFIMMRIGAYSSFTPRYSSPVPSFKNNTNGIIGSTFVNFVGYIP
jgi:hypothetical protein